MREMTMQAALVGDTGFVGSNLCKQTRFEATYHSTNIQTAYGTKPDLLVYAGVRAEKFLANQFPEQDMAMIQGAMKNIQEIQPKKLVLLSTIDIYQNPQGVTEETEIVPNALQPYGYHRYLLEEWVAKHCEESVIVRLPGLFGENIKKNFIYDYIHRIPTMLKPEKMEELIKIEPMIVNYYKRQENGFYGVKELEEKEKETLRGLLKHTGFSALFFTDSRGIFQFYNLDALWGDIQKTLEFEIRKINLAPEPVQIGELYQYLTGTLFVNEIAPTIPHYDFRSNYAEVFGGKNGYMNSKETVLKQIKEFVEYEISHL